MKKPVSTIYCGTRLASDQGTCSQVVVVSDGKPLTPEASQRMTNHSPDGFNWGYGGSGPAQLALAILLDYYGKGAPALRYYQAFKFKVIGGLPDEWTLTGVDIEKAIREIEAERRTE